MSVGGYDSPTLASVPLMPVVSGVVLVARMNHSSRVHRQAPTAGDWSRGGTPLGVVATGVTTGVGYEQYYTRYYTRPSANGDRGRFGRRQQPVGGSSGTAGD